MKRLLYILMFGILLSCSNDNSIAESKALEQIVMKRTEGLVLLQSILNHSNSYEHEMVCSKMVIYYTESQPNLVGLCKNRILDINMQTYENIEQKIKALAHDTSSYYENLVGKLIKNLQDQRALYLTALEDRKLKNLHSYLLDSYLQITCFIDDWHYSPSHQFVAR